MRGIRRVTFWCGSAVCSTVAGGQVVDASVLERGRMYVQIAERVSPHVHVLRQRDPNFAGVVGNTTVVEQRDGLVLVDAGASHGSGERIVQLVRAISAKPVTAVVITHWHGDHVLGLSAILRAWPAAEVIAHENAQRDIATRLSRLFPTAPSREYEVERARSLDAAYADIERNQAAAAATDAERRGWRATLGARALRLADVAGTHLLTPTRTFTSTLMLRDAVAPVELRFLGRANTSGDIVAWVPGDSVLVAGDIVVAPTPFMIQVYPSELLETLARIRAIPFTRLIPGHGVPQEDRRYLDETVRLVQSVRAKVAPLAKAGVPLDSISQRTQFETEQSAFARGDTWIAYWFTQYTLVPLIESVYNESLGRPLGPAPITQTPQ